MIGTILPTAGSIASNHLWYRRNEAMREKVARSELAHCERRIVGDEIRYYRNSSEFAVVSLYDHRVRWFHHRPDGVYAIPGNRLESTFPQ